MPNTTPTLLSRRSLVAAAVLAAASRPLLAQQQARPLAIEVWKDAGCGCCKDWIAHLEANGFKVKAHEGGNQTVRAKLGIAQKFGSCHTGVIGGYAIEGHVPAREIRRLLQDKPQAIGLSVPGMPIGSPGMDGPAYSNRQDRYDVLLLTRDGGSRVWQAYVGTEPRKA
jgi:hypothetical protein